MSFSGATPFTVTVTSFLIFGSGVIYGGYTSNTPPIKSMGCSGLNSIVNSEATPGHECFADTLALETVKAFEVVTTMSSRLIFMGAKSSSTTIT